MGLKIGFCSVYRGYGCLAMAPSMAPAANEHNTWRNTIWKSRKNSWNHVFTKKIGIFKPKCINDENYPHSHLLAKISWKQQVC